MIYNFSLSSSSTQVTSMVKAKNDDGSSTDSGNDKDKQDDKLGSGCIHFKKSYDSSKLKKALKANGINEKCCECKKMPENEVSSDEMFEYDNTLWLCLRCGSQLCGRRMNKHALEHFNVR